MRSSVLILIVFCVLVLCGLSCTPVKKDASVQAGNFTFAQSSSAVGKMQDSILSSDEQKLVTLLNAAPLPFSDAKGEAAALAGRILAEKALFLADLRAVLAADTDNLLIRVDKEVLLDESYVPPFLIPLTAETARAGSYVINRSDLSLCVPAEKALSDMARAARAQGITLLVSSTYRSYTYQKKVYERNVAQLGKAAADRESARPGASQHQLGTVIDFGSITDEYATTNAGKWLAAHAGTFGWSLSFPDGYEFITGYRWECWHYRYIGAQAVRFQEKWFNNVQQYMIEFIHAWKNAPPAAAGT